MNPQDYQSIISANVPVKEAFEKIGRISEWWTRKGYTGESKKLGDKFRVSFGETYVDFEIVEVIPDRSIVWRVNDSCLNWLTNKKEWNGTSVIWILAPEGRGARITMTHQGLRPEVECFEQCKAGWNFYSGQSLLKLLNAGRGLPDREP